MKEIFNFEYPSVNRNSSIDLPRKVGVEIETETDERIEPLLSWELTRDGSLVGGVELVSVPFNSETYEEVIGELKKQEDKIFKNPSVRTSVHIHVDVRRLNPYKVLKGFILIEPFLTGLYPERENNLYCSHWNGFASRLLLSYEEQELKNRSKYMSFSLNRYDDLKTVEYRFLPLLTCADDVLMWADFLSEFTDAAARIDYSARDVYRFEFCRSWRDFVNILQEKFNDNVARKFNERFAVLVDNNDEYISNRSRMFCATDVVIAYDILDTRNSRSDEYV